MRTGIGTVLVVALAACGPAGSGKPGGDGDGGDAPGETDETDAAPSTDCDDLALSFAGPGDDDRTARIGVARLPADPWDPAFVETLRLDVGLPAGLEIVARLQGPIEARLADGTPLADGDPVPDDVAREGLALRAVGPGDGRLRLVDAEEACDPVAVEVVADSEHDLVVRGVPGLDVTDPTDLLRADEQVEVRIRGRVHGDLAGEEADLYVVAHRTPEAWAADRALVDVTAEVEAITLPDPDETLTVAAWSADLPSPTWIARFDVVLDVDRDGTLSPGDRIDGLGAPSGFAVAGDLAADGGFTPTKRRWSGGFMRGQEVWYPVEGVGGDPLPLVVISHGNGHDYRWYDHLGRHLASRGLVVMAHENNTGPGIQSASTTTLANTELFLQQADTLFDGALAGSVDGSRIAWIGHSRGGEGVAHAYDRLVEGRWSTTAYAPGDIRLISSIAPTVFEGIRDSDPHDRPYHLLAGASDGDVTGGVDCDICQFLRIPSAALGPVAVTYLHGASHNVFHNGGGWDDGQGPARFDRPEVHPLMQATYAALLGWRLLDLPELGEALKRSAEVLRPLGAGEAIPVASTWREASDADVLLVDSFQIETDAAVNDLGGAVTWTVTDVVEDTLRDANDAFVARESDPMNGMTLVAGFGWERGVVFGWQDAAHYRTELPGGLDASGQEVLSLRVAQGTRHEDTVALGGPLTFEVVLEDGAGTRATLPTAPWAQVTTPYARTGLGAGAGWANEWNTVRLPLPAFTDVAPDLDLTDLAAVELRFGNPGTSARGRLGLDDLYFGEK